MMMSLLHDLQATYCINVGYICWYKAGGNETFKQLCKQEGMDVKFEHVLPETP